METSLRCPLCGKGNNNRNLALYGRIVCKKCFYGFVNRRQLAYIIDIGLFKIISLAIGFAMGYALISAHMDVMAWQPVMYFGDFLLFLAFTCKDGFSGQSFGKLLTGISVVDTKTEVPIGIAQSFKRNICMLIPFAPLYIAVTMNKGQRLGDRWAGTKVIWNKYAENPVFAAGVSQPRDVPPVFVNVRVPSDDDNPYQSP